MDKIREIGRNMLPQCVFLFWCCLDGTCTSGPLFARWFRISWRAARQAVPRTHSVRTYWFGSRHQQFLKVFGRLQCVAKFGNRRQTQVKLKELFDNYMVNSSKEIAVIHNLYPQLALVGAGCE